MQQQDLVTTLKAELLRVMGEIKALKDGNSSLKEQLGQLQDKDSLVVDTCDRQKSPKTVDVAYTNWFARLHAL